MMDKKNKRRTILMIVMGAFLLFSIGAASAAEWANPGLLVTPEIVKKNIDKPNWVVVDARDLKDYAKGHIPGAISLGKRAKKAFRDPTARVFSDVAKYEKFLGKAGIGNDTHVVFYYGDIKTITDATVGFWVMEYLGHDKVYILNGGLDAWRNAGYRLDKKPVMKDPKTFKVAKVVKSRYASTDEIAQVATGKNKKTQVIDSRSKNEFVGKDVRAIRGGHVPNVALHMSHMDTLAQVKDKKTGKMKTIAYLDPGVASEKFGSLDKNRRTVAYCQTGTRSTLTYLQLRLLGFKDPANWDDSWRVYGSNYADYPIEAPNGEQWYNFAKVNKTLKKLAKKIKKLEAELAKSKGGK